MASPFKAFRKHQKVITVAAGVLLMLVFTLGGVMSGLRGRGGGQVQDPVVVTTVYGALHESELNRMVRMRTILKSFLFEAWQRGMQQGQPEARPIMDYQSPVNEETTVNQMILARKAEQQGFVIGDDVINRYLTQLTGGVVNEIELRRMIEGASVDRRPVTVDQLFDVLRQEMLAVQFNYSYQQALLVSPAQRWQAFLKLHDRIRLEVMPMPVENFLAKVPDPKPSELEVFFNKYKDRYAGPEIVGGVRMDPAEPGFLQPQRMAFGYFQAGYDDIHDRVAAEVIDEEIAEFYERNKERLFERPELFEDEGPEADQIPGPPEPKDEDEAETPESQKPNPGQPPEPKDEPEPTPKLPGKPPSDTDSRRAPLHPPALALAARTLVTGALALADVEDAGEPAAKTPAVKKDAAAKQDAAAKKEQGNDAPSPVKAVEKAPPEKPAAEKAPDGKESAAEPKTKQPDAVLPASEEPKATLPEKKKPKQYRPLDEVKDEIRRRLADEKTAARIESILAPLSGPLETYSRQLVKWERRREIQPDLAQARPAPPDFKKMAEEAGLTFHESVPLSEAKLRETPLGQAELDTGATFGRGPELSQQAFGTALRLYNPMLARSYDTGDRYLVWKVSESEQLVPKLDQVRDQVVRAWKMIKARDLALKQAEELARSARELHTELSRVFAGEPGQEVLRTEPFSWLSDGPVPQGVSGVSVHLSVVDGVQQAGERFMERVFSLKPGEVAVVTNHPQTVVYVVRMVGHEAALAALRERFMGRGGLWNQLAFEENQRLVSQQLNRALNEEAEVHWHREADQPRSPSEGA